MNDNKTGFVFAFRMLPRKKCPICRRRPTREGGKYCESCVLVYARLVCCALRDCVTDVMFAYNDGKVRFNLEYYDPLRMLPEALKYHYRFGRYSLLEKHDFEKSYTFVDSEVVERPDYIVRVLSKAKQKVKLKGMLEKYWS